MTFREYFRNVGLALSRLVNALRGGDPDEGLSSPLGRSILRGGLASRVPWPGWLREHFKDAAGWD